MANIIKRGDNFRIKVSCGYDVNGRQVVKSKTYKPDTAKSKQWNEKELQRQAILFEESCKQGQSVTAAKFETFAREWFKDYAELKLKRLTLCDYHWMKKRAYAALGHSTPATTLSIYSHAFGNAQTRAMEAIANAIDI